MGGWVGWGVCWWWYYGAGEDLWTGGLVWGWLGTLQYELLDFMGNPRVCNDISLTA